MISFLCAVISISAVLGIYGGGLGSREVTASEFDPTKPCDEQCAGIFQRWDCYWCSTDCYARCNCQLNGTWCDSINPGGVYRQSIQDCDAKCYHDPNPTLCKAFCKGVISRKNYDCVLKCPENHGDCYETCMSAGRRMIGEGTGVKSISGGRSFGRVSRMTEAECEARCENAGSLFDIHHCQDCCNGGLAPLQCHCHAQTLDDPNANVSYEYCMGNISKVEYDCMMKCILDDSTPSFHACIDPCLSAGQRRIGRQQGASGHRREWGQ